MTRRRLRSPGRQITTGAVCVAGVLALAGATTASAAAAAHGPTSHSSASASGDIVKQMSAKVAPSSPSTVKGPTTPTTDEPGDNEPALVIGGIGAASALVAGAFVVARRRVTDDPR